MKLKVDFASQYQCPLWLELSGPWRAKIAEFKNYKNNEKLLNYKHMRLVKSVDNKVLAKKKTTYIYGYISQSGL